MAKPTLVLGTKAEATPTDLKLSRRHEIVKAKEWHTITTKFRRAKPEDRRRFAREVRYELDVTDLRDFTVGIVHETFGRSESAWDEVQALGGCHKSTGKSWEGTGARQQVLRPQMAKIRQVLLTCGWDLVPVKLKL